MISDQRLPKTEAGGLKIILNQSFEKTSQKAYSRKENVDSKLTGTIQGKKWRKPNKVIPEGVETKKKINWDIKGINIANSKLSNLIIF